MISIKPYKNKKNVVYIAIKVIVFKFKFINTLFDDVINIESTITMKATITYLDNPSYNNLFKLLESLLSKFGNFFYYLT